MTLKLPKAAFAPREAVLQMAPYSPPTGGPRGQAAPRFQREYRRLLRRMVIDFIKQLSDGDGPGRLSGIRAGARGPRRRTSASRPTSSLFTNGTDEAIQVSHQHLRRRRPGSADPKPSYAMYRFYAEVAGAKFARSSTGRRLWIFRWKSCWSASRPNTRRSSSAIRTIPTGTGDRLRHLERILQARAQGRRAGR